MFYSWLIRKACLIRPNYICEEYWLKIYLFHDYIAPCITSLGFPVQECLKICWPVWMSTNFFRIFQTRQFFLICLVLLFGYVTTYANKSSGLTCFPTLAGLPDRGRLITQPISLKRFLTI